MEVTSNQLLSGVLFECASCGKLFDQDANIPGAIISNFCPTCAGKVFMGQSAKQAEETPDVKELLELSTLYHRLISDLSDQWGIRLTPELRHRAFQLVSKVGDEVKIKTLATLVLKEVQPRNTELPYKGPISIPCSACSAGDYEMEHHDHDGVPERLRRK